ncbi:MAG: tetratricopeptide repeat protein [Bacteroidota bacterium]
MKWFALSILMLFSLSGEDGVLSQAEIAYAKGAYTESVQLYRQALRQYPEKSTQIRFNIAQCYAMMDSTLDAIQNYEQATRSADAELASNAFNNLGEISAKQENLEKAKDQFMRALNRNPDNSNARYNYELALRLLEAARPDNPEPEEQPQEEAPPQTQQDLPDYIQQAINLFPQQQRFPGDEKRAMDTISLSLARTKLEAMRREDKQFVQQLKRRYKPSKAAKASERPNW